MLQLGMNSRSERLLVLRAGAPAAGKFPLAGCRTWTQLIEFERVESREVDPAVGELAGFYGFVSTGFVDTPLLT